MPSVRALQLVRETLMKEIEQRARKLRLTQLYVLTTKTACSRRRESPARNVICIDGCDPAYLDDAFERSLVEMKRRLPDTGETALARDVDLSVLVPPQEIVIVLDQLGGTVASWSLITSQVEPQISEMTRRIAFATSRASIGMTALTSRYASATFTKPTTVTHGSIAAGTIVGAGWLGELKAIAASHPDADTFPRCSRRIAVGTLSQPRNVMCHEDAARAAGAECREDFLEGGLGRLSREVGEGQIADRATA